MPGAGPISGLGFQAIQKIAIVHASLGVIWGIPVQRKGGGERRAGASQLEIKPDSPRWKSAPHRAGHIYSMTQISCNCGAVYKALKTKGPTRDAENFKCAVCGNALFPWAGSNGA